MATVAWNTYWIEIQGSTNSAFSSPVTKRWYVKGVKPARIRAGEDAVKVGLRLRGTTVFRWKFEVDSIPHLVSAQASGVAQDFGDFMDLVAVLEMKWKRISAVSLPRQNAAGAAAWGSLIPLPILVKLNSDLDPDAVYGEIGKDELKFELLAEVTG